MPQTPASADLSLLSREEWSSAAMPASENVTLTLDPFPGSIDGHVGGVFGVSRGLSAAQEFVVELLCKEYRSDGGIDRRGLDDSTLWQDIGTFIARPRADGGVDVPFCFEVPASAPYTRSRSNDAREDITWMLRVASKPANEDFERHWRIPILASGQRASSAIAQTRAVAHAADTDAQLYLEQDAAGLTMDYPPLRAASAAPLLLVGGAAFCGAAWYMGHKNALFMSFLSWLTGLLMAASGLWLVGNGLRVELRSSTLSITRRLFGITVRRASVPLSHVAGIACARSGFSENGAETKVYYWIVLTTLDGASHVIGDSFVGYSQAMAGARRLAQLTGLKVLE